MANTDDGLPEPGPSSASPVSFGFTRTSVRRRLADPGAGAGSDPEEKDFLKTVEGGELQGVKPLEAPGELVIPLIQNGRRRQPLVQTPVLSTEVSVDGVLSQAVKELNEESKKSLEEREDAGVEPTLAIPMIQKGCIPSGARADREPRADTAPKEANYEAVPVESYGLAMLRGMGWKPGEGIGRTFNQVVKPCINSLRPKGLGLGTNVIKTQAAASTGSYCPPRPDGEQQKDKEDQPQGLVPGGPVVVRSGPHRDLYGTVEGLDPDNVRAMVRLAVDSRMVTVSEYCLQPVSQQEFDKKSLHTRQMNRTRGRHSGTPLSQNAHQSEDLHGRQEDSERKRKLPLDGQDGPAAKSEKAATRSQHWLHRDLRVRFVDKLYKGGQYYNTKMTIEDVLSPDTCVCQTDEGQVLEGLRENMLETLVPKVKGDRVMVVLGPWAGRVGHLLSSDKAQSHALVRLWRDNQVLELHYDAICQYMGPSDSDGD